MQSPKLRGIEIKFFFGGYFFNRVNENYFCRGTFARNSVLRLLNMSHNKLKRLDSNSFRGMRFLRYINIITTFVG